MSDVLEMSLKEAVAQFPKFAAAMACIEPHIGLFDSRKVDVEKTGRFFYAASCLTSPDLHKDIKKWDATFFADWVRVSGYETKEPPWICRKSQRFTLEEFADFLQRVSDHQKQAGKAPRGRKPAEGRYAPAITGAEEEEEKLLEASPAPTPRSP